MPEFITNLYHGTSKVPNDNLKVPLFVTTDKGGAQWFTHGEGVILEGNLITNNVLVLDRYEQIDNILKELEIDFKRDPYFECDEISKYSNYDGTNENDIFFIPKVRDYMIKQGYDAIKVSDVLLNYEIETYIVLKEGLFNIDKVYTPTEVDSDYGKEFIYNIVEKYKPNLDKSSEKNVTIRKLSP